MLPMKIFKKGKSIMPIKFSKEICLKIEWIILFLLGISHYINIPLLSIVLTITLIVLMMFLNIYTATIILFSALPFFNLFNKKIGQTSLYYILIVIFIVKYFSYKNNKISINKMLLFLWLFILRITSLDLKLLITWSLVILVLILTYNEDILVNQIKIIVRGISISMILSSIWGYIYLLSGKSIYNNGQIYMNGIITTRFAGLVGDSVFFAQISTVLIASNLVIFYFSKEHKKENIIYSLILTGFTFLTYSKTGFLMVAFIYLSFASALVYKNLKSRNTMYKSIFIIMIVIFITIYLFNYVIKNLDNIFIKNYLLRFTSNDLLTGRNIVFNHYISLLTSTWTSLFIAMPQSTYSEPFPISVFTEINTAHNIYIESICAFGFISALILFFILIYILIKNLIKSRKLFSYIPLVLLLISGFVLHGHFESHYYILFALALSFTNINYNKNLL